MHALLLFPLVLLVDGLVRCQIRLEVGEEVGSLVDEPLHSIFAAQVAQFAPRFPRQDDVIGQWAYEQELLRFA